MNNWQNLTIWLKLIYGLISICWKMKLWLSGSCRRWRCLHHKALLVLMGIIFDRIGLKIELYWLLNGPYSSAQLTTTQEGVSHACAMFLVVAATVLVLSRQGVILVCTWNFLNCRRQWCPLRGKHFETRATMGPKILKTNDMSKS